MRDEVAQKAKELNKGRAPDAISAAAKEHNTRGSELT
jgi:hypothetical protein